MHTHLENHPEPGTPDPEAPGVEPERSDDADRGHYSFSPSLRNHSSGIVRGSRLRPGSSRSLDSPCHQYLGIMIDGMDGYSCF